MQSVAREIPAEVEKEFPKIALHLVQYNHLDSINGSDVYEVKEGWHKAELRNLEAIKIVSNAIEFEESLNNENIYVPVESGIPYELVKRILERRFARTAIFIDNLLT